MFHAKQSKQKKCAHVKSTLKATNSLRLHQYLLVLVLALSGTGVRTIEVRRCIWPSLVSVIREPSMCVCTYHHVCNTATYYVYKMLYKIINCTQCKFLECIPFYRMSLIQEFLDCTVHFIDYYKVQNIYILHKLQLRCLQK